MKAYNHGQRLVEVSKEAPKGNAYKLNFGSDNFGVAGLNLSTIALLVQLDKYEGALAFLRVSHQMSISAYEPNTFGYKDAVKDMALSLWDNLPMNETVRGFSKVKAQFLTHVEWMYIRGQRLTLVTDAPAPVEDGTLVSRMYQYCLNSEIGSILHHCQRRTERVLDDTVTSASPRMQIALQYAELVRRVADEYAISKAYGCDYINATVMKDLREYFAIKYLDGVRRK
jgi:hypothetical protein